MLHPRDFSLATFASHLRVHAPQLAINLVLVGLWLYLYRTMFDYLGVVALREDFRTNQLVLVGIIALILFQVYSGQFHVQFQTAPRAYPLPLGLAIGGSLAYLIAERVLDINTLSATLFGIATYGLVGLWMSPRSWRDGLPAALLLIGVLPFGEHMQTFIGYPMRIFTAELVRDGLGLFGVTSAGVDTILVLENGISQIDLPCSGVKSLWTGALFFLAVTWLERAVLNVRWLLVATVFVILLFVANLVRVGMLVVTADVLNVPLAAEMLHVPLGVLGFAGACAGALVLLRWGNGKRAEKAIALNEPGVGMDTGDDKLRAEIALSQNPLLAMTDSHCARKRQEWSVPQFSLVLGIGLCVLGLLYAQRPETGLGQSTPLWKFPAALRTEPLPLKPDEEAWLTRDGAESAARYRFDWQGVSGTMILVPSRTWRAHHRPERCFEVFGLQLNDSKAQLVADDFPIRAVTLLDPKSEMRLDAAYWFQSATRTTDDYGTRIWADTTAPGERWVLVSILFSQPIDSNDARATALYRALDTAVAAQIAAQNAQQPAQ